jgi:hypothetical protein
MRTVIFLLLLIIISNKTFGQGKDTTLSTLSVQMDEFVLKASRAGWDVEGFIRRVKTDTTFYKAFKTLHLVPATLTNNIYLLDKDGAKAATYYSKTRQLITNRCRSTQVIEEKTTGDFYKKNGDYNYYTAELYAYLFFVKGKICNENNIIAGNENERGRGQLEKHKWQLKQLIFNPGSKVAGVPFSGNKAAIFDPGIAKMYDFKLMSVEYDGQDCLLFSAIPKPQYKNEVVYNELSTWFRQSDYAIVARDYSLSFSTMVYDFDVTMKVRLKDVAGKLLPSKIVYNGNWKVATKKRERAQFTTLISY